MRLVINGEEKQFDGISTLASLVEQLGLKADRLAIELNRDIVPRATWNDTSLKEDDRLEIVHFVGGG
jgi:sulfur carrier protein